MANNFEFYTGLRGYHVYSNNVGWKSYVPEKIKLKREHKNPHDKFAVAGKVTMKGKIGLIVVGYVPREVSQYVWYSIQEGAKYDVEVHKNTPMASPLLQGGLEIPIKVTVTWNEPEKLSILVVKVQAVEHLLIGEHVDDSKKILPELGIKADEEDGENDDDSDCEVDDEDVEIQAGTVVNEDIEMS